MSGDIEVDNVPEQEHKSIIENMACTEQNSGGMNPSKEIIVSYMTCVEGISIKNDKGCEADCTKTAILDERGFVVDIGNVLPSVTIVAEESVESVGENWSNFQHFDQFLCLC